VDAKKTLAEFKKKVDPQLDIYFSRMIAENEKKDKNIGDAIRCARDITMSGGKRARAAFMYFGYVAAGGSDLSEMLKTSISIELIHSFLLIHDDIIDQDELRHGVKTIHTVYEEFAKQHFKNKDAAHFGNSMAIIIGDMINSFGGQVLFESKFSPALVIKALHEMQKIISSTIIGQAEDIYIENRGYASEKEILQMYENKTAKYTLEGPLHLGAILAGADESILKALSAYSIPAGIAFQIQDDILGVFGQVKKTGKPVGSDVRQGKQTLLVAKALEKAGAKDKLTLQKCLGKMDLTEAELDEFRAIIKSTGSLAYAENLATELIAAAKHEITGANIDNVAKEFLFGIADYMLNREV
jgi:geranylgeranyl diphosphate synthase type I